MQDLNFQRKLETDLNETLEKIHELKQSEQQMSLLFEVWKMVYHFRIHFSQFNKNAKIVEDLTELEQQQLLEERNSLILNFRKSLTNKLFILSLKHLVTYLEHSPEQIRKPKIKAFATTICNQVKRIPQDKILPIIRVYNEMLALLLGKKQFSLSETTTYFLQEIAKFDDEEVINLLKILYNRVYQAYTLRQLDISILYNLLKESIKKGSIFNQDVVTETEFFSILDMLEERLFTIADDEYVNYLDEIKSLCNILLEKIANKYEETLKEYLKICLVVWEKNKLTTEHTMMINKWEDTNNKPIETRKKMLKIKFLFLRKNEAYLDVVKVLQKDKSRPFLDFLIEYKNCNDCLHEIQLLKEKIQQRPYFLYQSWLLKEL